MSEQFNTPRPGVNEAEPVPVEKIKRDGGLGGAGRKAKPDPRPLPGINLGQLIQERNWTALAGLALMVLGTLVLIEDVLGIDLNLWSVTLIGLGGGLMIDAWQRYEAAGHAWIGNARNRLLGGGVMALVGLLSVFDLSAWGLLLLGVAGWLAWDSWKKYEANGRVWTEPGRTRMVAAAAIGLVGLLEFVSVSLIWPLILIAAGALMLFKFGGRGSCC